MASNQDIQKNILKFTLSLYANNFIPRNVVQTFIDYIREFMNIILVPFLEQQICLLLQNNNCGSQIDDVKAILNYSKTLFDSVATEHLRFQLYKKKGCYIEPENFVIGQTEVDKVNEDRPISENDDVHAVHVPLHSKLINFLEIPSVFSQINEHMTFLRQENNIISNILQGSLWQKRSASHGDKLYLPINIFHDEVETKNPLGSHAGRNKIGVTYATLPCLPPHLVSRLDCILLTTLFYGNDRKIFGNKWVFRRLIEDLKKLQNKGITITINSEKIRVYFECTLILGDNLGLNGILGFVESFSAHHPCRFCKILNDDLKKSVVEDANLLRTPENYKADIKKNDVSVTGLKEECIFNIEGHYHVCENSSVDIMHDIFEGSGNYAMTAILYTLIYVDKLLTTDIIIRRMELFQYGHLESGNKPPPAALDHVKDKKMIRMSASEMLCLIRYFGLMVGDLIPETNEVWKLYLKLRQIVGIVTAPKLLRDHAITLIKLVEDYNALYLIFDGSLTLTSHNLIHYWQLILKIGPLLHYWSMRCESRNRDIRAIATATCCTKNLLYTIAVKDQLKMADTIVSGDFELKVSFGPVQKRDFSDVKQYFDISRSKMKCYSHITSHGQKYLPGMVVVIGIDDNNDPLFGQIMDIISVDGQIFFCMYSMKTLYFEDHYHAFCVSVSDKMDTVKDKSSMLDLVPCILVKKKNLENG